ncbi:MAG: RtcB family protein [Candidatus Bipolaricaulota bacterium]|nr:MAG: RtcB family protein [Candidatus Bipolaricaulota bacterium]
MLVPAVVFADREMVDELQRDEAGSEWSALRQLRNVACLPGIVGRALALPDVHPGYGFPIGGVAAFDVKDGVVVVGGVGFDINCGVRLLSIPLSADELGERAGLADALFAAVPAGLGSKGSLRMTVSEIDRLLREGAAFAVGRGLGLPEDLPVIEESGCVSGADPETVSERAKQRQFRQVGTLGSGNHYLEVQRVDELFDPAAASVYGLDAGQAVISVHTGSRALGHQIGQDYLKIMGEAGRRYGLPLPERELACAPVDSDEGRRYLSAVACGANCAFANRQVIAHLVRGVLADRYGVSPSSVRTVYDIGHNNAKRETHDVDGVRRELIVHRKGSTRALGPGAEDVPAAYRSVGHPILVGGTMGTSSYVMRGTPDGMRRAFGSGVHGAGRALSRKKAAKKYWGEDVLSSLHASGIELRAHSLRGVAEEAPGAYKDVERVVAAAEDAGINRRVARLRPLVVIKG